jgi:hypothetical protein
MALQTIYADADLSGNATNPENAVGAPDDVFTTNLADSWTNSWNVPNVEGLLATQQVVVRLRRSGPEAEPSATINIRSGGAIVGTKPNTVVLSTTGEDFVVDFDGTGLSGPLSVEVVAARDGGRDKRTIQVDAITWFADLAVFLGSTFQTFDGGGWVPGTLKRYDGGAWVPAQVQKYDGSQWQDVA